MITGLQGNFIEGVTCISYKELVLFFFDQVLKKDALLLFSC